MASSASATTYLAAIRRAPRAMRDDQLPGVPAIFAGEHHRDEGADQIAAERLAGHVPEAGRVGDPAGGRARRGRRRPRRPWRGRRRSRSARSRASADRPDPDQAPGGAVAARTSAPRREIASSIARLLRGDGEEHILEIALHRREAEQVDAGADQPAHHLRRLGPGGGDRPAPRRPARPPSGRRARPRPPRSASPRS